MNDIGKNIRRLREKADMSQEELGRKLGKTRSAVSQYEAGKIVPRMGVIEDLAAIFRVLVRLYRFMSQDDRETLLKTARSFAALTGVDRIGSERAVGRSMR